jgi:heme exporter protein A
VSSEGWAVSAEKLQLRLGETPILRSLSFRVGWGERRAILGPNGAGKTSLLKLIAGLLRPTSGELRVAGLDPARDGAAIRARLGLLSHQTYLYHELTATENLRFYGRLYGVPDLVQRVDQVLDQVGLYSRRHERVGQLSRGLQQRLGIARAMVHDPDVLLLDEPDTGLDLQAFHLLESIALAADRQRTILLTTHNLEYARQLCHSGLVLVGGRLAGELAVTELDSGRLERLYGVPSPVHP